MMIERGKNSGDADMIETRDREWLKESNDLITQKRKNAKSPLPLDQDNFIFFLSSWAYPLNRYLSRRNGPHSPPFHKPRRQQCY